jgi:hypothetical protein
VLQFDNTYAGIILLAGQISDSVSTVFVGYFSDKPVYILRISILAMAFR